MLELLSVFVMFPTDLSDSDGSKYLWGKPKGQSRMDNLESLAKLGTQDIGRRPTKHNTTQKTK